MEHPSFHEELLRGRMLNIEVGTRLQLQVGPGDSDLKLTGVLIGQSPEEFLTIAIPAVPGVLAKLYEGSRVTVRYMYSGGVYGFTCSVINFIHKPKLIVFISYPRAIEVFNLRKTQRRISLLPVLAELDNERYGGILIDLSEGGCRLSIESDETLPIISPGDSIKISMQFGGTGRLHIVRGTLQSVKHGGKFAEMGIQFETRDSELKIQLGNYLKNISTVQEKVSSVNRTVA